MGLRAKGAQEGSMIKAATTSIVHDDARSAGRDAADELLDQLGERPDLVLLFASARYDQEAVLAGLHGRLGEGVRLAGCSSYAEIGGREALSESVTAMGLKLGDLGAATLSARAEGGDSRALGRSIGEQARAHDPSLLVVFPDGLQVNSTQFLLGIQDVLGKSFPIVGGVAADTGEFTRTFQYRDREVFSGGAAAVALRGSISLATAARSGWYPVGASRICTRMEGGNVCLELDRQPALALYKEYLGARAAEMPLVSAEYPIGVISSPEGTQRLPEGELLLLRSIKGVDEARQAIIFGGDLPQGSEVRMTSATKEDVMKGADEATERACAAMPEPSLALIFNCMARKVVLGPRYKQELSAPLRRLGERVPAIGFYTYGELSPVQGVTMHHDETFTIALLKG